MDANASRHFSLTELYATLGPALAIVAILLGGLMLRYETDASVSWRWQLFDALQDSRPRVERAANVVVVAIDEAALARHGRWPWPRGTIGELVATIAQSEVSAIGIDVTFREPDNHDRYVNSLYNADTDLVGRLLELPTQDEVFAYHLSTAPVVLTRQGSDLRGPVISSIGDTPLQFAGAEPRNVHPLSFPHRLTNVEVLERFARGLGFTNAPVSDDQVVRKVPLMLRVEEQWVPSFALEMLRVAAGANWITVHTDRYGLTGVSLHDHFFPTDVDGQIHLRYARYQPEVWVSAADVMAGQAADKLAQADIVVVGVTALDLTDAVTTPVWKNAIGVDVHLQTLENLLLGQGLVRSTWAPWLEYLGALAIFLAIGLGAPRLPYAQAAGLSALLLLVPVGLAMAGFTYFHQLVDPSWWVISAVASTLTVALSQFAATRRVAVRLQRRLQDEREERARLTGELSAARDIQMGMLPDTDKIRGLPKHVDVYGFVRPAKEVGGDLYDAFMLDDTRMFFVIGDVAGKGIPASLFMALGKTLCKSNALRGPESLETLVNTANEEISRDNPGLMFITALFGVLDTATGQLTFCNAGHDPAIVVADGLPTSMLQSKGGPPLCVVDDFPYPSDVARMRPGTTLVMVTDGITEAQADDAELYGRERLLAQLEQGPREPRALVRALVQSVDDFVDGADQFDDLTVLAVRWDAPANP